MTAAPGARPASRWSSSPTTPATTCCACLALPRSTARDAAARGRGRGQRQRRRLGRRRARRASRRAGDRERREPRASPPPTTAAWRAAAAPYVLFLNSDAEVRPGAVEALVAVLDARPDVGIVGPRTLGADGRIQVSFGPRLTPLAEWRQRRLVARRASADDRRRCARRSALTRASTSPTGSPARACWPGARRSTRWAASTRASSSTRRTWTSACGVRARGLARRCSRPRPRSSISWAAAWRRRRRAAAARVPPQPPALLPQAQRRARHRSRCAWLIAGPRDCSLVRASGHETALSAGAPSRPWRWPAA